MLEHYKGTTGYAWLYLVMLFGVILLTGLMSGLMGALGVSEAGKIAGGVVFLAFWILGFFVMQRFIAIEGRQPSLSESNIIGLKSVLYIFVPIFCLVLLIGVVTIIGQLLGGGGEGRPPNAGNSGSSDDQNLQAVTTVWSVLAAMFLLYVAPFLNFAIFSRFFKPRAD